MARESFVRCRGCGGSVHKDAWVCSNCGCFEPVDGDPAPPSRAPAPRPARPAPPLLPEGSPRPVQDNPSDSYPASVRFPTIQRGSRGRSETSPSHRICSECGAFIKQGKDVCGECGSIQGGTGPGRHVAVDQAEPDDPRLPSGNDPAVLPSLKGWNWGAFGCSWVWAFAHGLPQFGWQTLMGWLMGGFPGFALSIYLGMNGNQLAWRQRSFANLDEFWRVQAAWSSAGRVLALIEVAGLVVALLFLGMWVTFGS